MTAVLFMWFFFFFQAEDGIRDHCVTGVQTCALPIYGRSHLRIRPSGHQTDAAIRVQLTKRSAELIVGPISVCRTRSANRSEERRVGKECRYRRSGDQSTKKGVRRARSREHHETRPHK